MKLLVMDVEGTLFRTNVRLPGTTIDSTIWQSIANALGPDAVEQEVETHRVWESGGYRSYLNWMKATVAIHRKFGLTQSVFQQLIRSAEYNPGVTETLPQINQAHYPMILVSGGFRELAARAQKDFKIEHAFAACEYLFDSSRRLAHYNLLPCDFEGKLDFIQIMLREYGLDGSDWLFVGDGLNDVPIAKASPMSIGFRPHPELRKIVTHVIDDFGELLEILNKSSRV